MATRCFVPVVPCSASHHVPPAPVHISRHKGHEPDAVIGQLLAGPLGRGPYPKVTTEAPRRLAKRHPAELESNGVSCSEVLTRGHSRVTTCHSRWAVTHRPVEASPSTPGEPHSTLPCSCATALSPAMYARPCSTRSLWHAYSLWGTRSALTHSSTMSPTCFNETATPTSSFERLAPTRHRHNHRTTDVRTVAVRRQKQRVEARSRKARFRLRAFVVLVTELLRVTQSLTATPPAESAPRPPSPCAPAPPTPHTGTGSCTPACRWSG